MGIQRKGLTAVIYLDIVNGAKFENNSKPFE